MRRRRKPRPGWLRRHRSTARTGLSGMPHLIVEWSANLRPLLDIGAFLHRAHDAAMETGAFAPDALRSRAVECVHARVADGHADNGFIHVVLRMRPGRDEATKRRIGEHVFAAMQAALASVFAARPLGLTFEMQEIDTANRWLAGNLDQHLARRSQAGEAGLHGKGTT